MLNATLHVLEHGCASKQFRQLAQHLHPHEPLTVCLTEFSHGSQEQMLRLDADGFSLGSMVIKVHPDGTGALKKWHSAGRQFLRRMDSKTASDCRIC